MNSDYEKQLEATVQRELRALGQLRAPGTLAARVMASIEHRVAVPWYQRAWQTWPLAWQIAFVLLLAAVLGGLSLGGIEVWQAASRSVTGQQLERWFVSIGTFWNTVSVLLAALVTALRQLGPGVLIGSALLLSFAYAACAGVGTACLRLAMARRQEINL